ncbi:DeoR/GlpR family DNA-binding transcription regulator [Phenylobacterium montanum]|uniref:DeoR/GlpR transcriptional regulator n=1 Tax=Phenylobacterium montanum TaxID=2823693 RepID=A0A975IXG3_9CAUL|nr:DeoR/GlpR family DNA-binding transcription regulator [Caulobacter sp. S6]QUD90614.1 DeoR/GlpR transcriptional regulator [Caulobacter sp. S6]
MHVAERERLILDLLEDRGIVGFQELDRRLEVSPATIRRDLDRLAEEGKIIRVRGGAALAPAQAAGQAGPGSLLGAPFHENVALHAQQKAAIGRAAAALCAPGESVIIDGGSTTLQMCPHLEPLGLQVLTNSLHIVSALMQQPGTRISVPAGTIFREQNIVLSPFEDDGMDRYHASKLFMGAAAIGRAGLMQADTLLVQAERRLLGRAEEIIVLVDSSKFSGASGHLVCALAEIDVIVTDEGIGAAEAKMVQAAGCRLIVA